MNNELEKEMTAPEPAVGAAEGQSGQVMSNHIIAGSHGQDNPGDSNKAVTPLQTISMAELFDQAFHPKVEIIDGILHEGAYLFVGAPKIGKSFFMAQLGYHVATGLPLWQHNTHKAAVLYLALEDDYARIQKRLFQMFGIDTVEQFYFGTQAQTLTDGLEEQLVDFLQKHPDTKLIIVDTLQKVRKVGGEMYSYSSDYDIGAKLKAFSDQYHICLLMVHHTRKMGSEDSFDMISGTHGLLGAADGAFVLQKKKRTDARATLSITGRDQSDQELTIEFNREKCLWELISMEKEEQALPPDPLLEAISLLVTVEHPCWQGSASELLLLLQPVELQPNTLTRHLNVASERLFNEYGILYESSRTRDSRFIRLSRGK